MTRRPAPAPSVPDRTSWQDDWTVLARGVPGQGDALHVPGAEQHGATRIEGCCVTTAQERGLLQDLEEDHRLFTEGSEPPAPHRPRGTDTSDASAQASEPSAPHRSRRGTDTSDASVGDADSVPTVLVADDEPDVRELARILLEVDGFEVVGEAIDGQDAFDRFVALDPPPVPTVVVLDNRMPGLNGLEVAALILERHPDQVIVLFTAFLDEHVEQQAHEIGVTACLSKLHAADLPGVLRNLLGI